MSASVTRGFLWLIASRGVVRVLDIVTLIVTARLLAPEDFGVLAMCTAVAAVLTMSVRGGIDHAVLFRTAVEDGDLHRAWSLRVMQSAGVAALLALASPIAAAWFQDGRVTGVLLLAALSVFLTGCENPGMIRYRAELRFQYDFQLEAVRKASLLATAIGLAALLGTYWAIAIAWCVSALAALLYSYVIAPFRPRFTTAKLSDLTGASAWIVIGNAANFVFLYVDRFVVGRAASASTLGAYNVAAQIADMPASEVLQPALNAVASGLSRRMRAGLETASAFLHATSAATALAVPAGILLAMLGDELVALLLGPRWADAGLYLAPLALASACRALAWNAGNYLIANGLLRTRAAILIAFTVVAVVVLPLAHASLGTSGMAWTLLGICGVLAIASYAVIIARTTVTLHGLGGALLRPTLACAGLWGTIAYTEPLVQALPAIARVGVPAVAGALAFVALLFASWHLAGRVDGPERALLEQLRRVRS